MCERAQRARLKTYDEGVEPREVVARALGSGRRAALVTVVGIEGGPPSKPGLALAVDETGVTYGTLGCDGFDRSGTADALRAIASGETLRARYDWDETSRIAVEVRPFRPGERVEAPDKRPELLIVGSGPVARALAQLARPLGFRVRVAAGPGDTSREDFSDADEVERTPDVEALRSLHAGLDTYVVICGHDEEFSQPALRRLMRSDAPYLGMMGSRRHTGHLLDELRAEGYAPDRIARVRSPVGLDVGAETPEEIALSALAQIVAVRRGGTGEPLSLVP